MTKKKSLPKKPTVNYYLLSGAFLMTAIVVLLSAPLLLGKTEQKLVVSALEIPKNNSAVLAVEHYNLPPTSLDIPVPRLTAKSVFVKDLGTGTVLYQSNAHDQVPIASTTKIMTALVANEYYQQNSVLIASEGARIAGSTVGLKPGEQLSFRSLLYGMLLNSGNDAAFTIAENYPGKVPGFIEAMNKKATDLGLINTHFENPAGFDSPNHFSSAFDLDKIAEAAVAQPELAKIFSTKQTEIFSLDKMEEHKLVNLNRLLTDVPGVLGIKTGYTDIAKENLVGLVERNGHEVLTVVLGSDDRFGETTSLIEWVYQNFSWQ